MKKNYEIMDSYRTHVERLISENNIQLNCVYAPKSFHLEFLNEIEKNSQGNLSGNCNVDLSITKEKEEVKYSWSIKSPSGYRLYEGKSSSPWEEQKESQYDFIKALYMCLKGDFEPEYKALKF